MADGTAEVPETLRETLRRHDQEHVLRYWGDLSSDERSALVRQLEAVDFALIEKSLREHHTATGETPAERAHRARPPRDLVRLSDTTAEWEAARRRGTELLAEGRVGSILVAGGQATRLGVDYPKGMYPIGPVSGKTLYQLLAEKLLARSRRAEAVIPYYVMTSEATHAPTVAFFEEHDYFGLAPEDVHFFRQGTMPAVDAETGRLLLEETGRLSTAPDGHGGLLKALHEAGLIDDMRRRGLEVLDYHQVDNPTAEVCDPVFLGFHALRDSAMSTKVVAKRAPEEKMGVVVDVDGVTQIIEYSDLPEEIARQTDESGNLRLWAGSTALHVFGRSFLERMTTAGNELPFHLAHKSVPHVDESGRPVTPEEPNAYKFERFIFDALPFAETALVLETDRAREFNPVKNREGADSPQTARQALSDLHRDWLEASGARVGANATVEISPLFALDAEEAAAKSEPGTEYTGDVYLQ